ncbi:MAG: glycosyltransferase family protein [Niabella sp.]
MKIFYAVQATGNGHISRAMELLPHLRKRGSVDIFLSGNNSNLKLDAPITYRSKGLSLYYTCNGKLDYWKIAKCLNPIALKKEIKDLPVEKYDLVINDYDYITSKACKAKNIPSVNFGHQASFQSDKVPRPHQKNIVGEWMLKSFATSERYLGLHFKEYDDFIMPPVVKQEIIDTEPKNLGHITVYLPSYCEKQLTETFSKFKDHRFEIFSQQSADIRKNSNLSFIPVNKQLFNKSLINSAGIITGGGFETPSEAIHLGKKIIAIPIGGQYEQNCNAAALQQMGIMTLKAIDANFTAHFENWMQNYQPVQIDYSTTIEKCMERLFG